MAGNGWLKWMACEFPCWVVVAAAGVPFACTDCMVVRVVARDRTDGAGDEKVLSPPLRDSRPPLAVRLVPAIDDAPCEGAMTEWWASWSVETVGAIDLPPAVGGGRPSLEARGEMLWSTDVALDVTPLCEVVKDCRLS